MSYRYYFLTAMLAVCFQGAAAQDNNTTFDIVFNPTIAGRILTSSTGFKNDETVTVMFDAGVLVKVVDRGRWQLQTGALFSRKGFSYGEVTYRDENNQPMGTGLLRQRVDYLEIPVRALLRMSTNNRNFLVAGLLNDIRLDDAATLDGKAASPGSFYPDPSNIRKYNVGLQLGYAHYFFADQKISFGIEPNIKFQLLTLHESDTPVKRHLFTLGMSAKLRLKA